MWPISYSQARLFSDCPARYKAEKLDKMKSEASLPMKIGAFLHTVAEHCAIAIVEGRDVPGEDLGTHALEADWLTEAHGLPEALHHDCLRLARQTAKRMTFYPKDVVGIEVNAAVDAIGNVVAYDDPGAAVRGRLDRLDARAEGGGTVVTVWDLKTGRAIENPEDSVQLALYGAFARAIEPDAASYMGKLYYPRYDSERSCELSQARMDGALKWAMDIRTEIEQSLAIRGAWRATPGRGCHDCPCFWTCEPRRLLSAEKVTVPQTEADAAAMVIRAEVLSRESAEIREMLQLFIKANGPIEVNGLVADIRARHTCRWPIKELLAVLRTRGLDSMKYLKGDTRKLRATAERLVGFGEDLDRIVDDRTTTELNIRRFGTQPYQEETQ